MAKLSAKGNGREVARFQKIRMGVDEYNGKPMETTILLAIFENGKVLRKKILQWPMSGKRWTGTWKLYHRVVKQSISSIIEAYEIRKDDGWHKIPTGGA